MGSGSWKGSQQGRGPELRHFKGSKLGPGDHGVLVPQSPDLTPSSWEPSKTSQGPCRGPEAGEQLAGGDPPDEKGEDSAEEERREQAAQGPGDQGCSLLGLILLGADRAIVG